MSSISKLPTVWLIGDADHLDFRASIELLHTTAIVSRFAAVAQTANELIEPKGIPDVIVLPASRPGMICAGDVERLRSRAPLVGMIALLGSWCEGETRTGRPLPGVPRCFWYDFPNWWRRQLRLLAAGRCPDWGQPATADTNDCAAKKSRQIEKASGGLILLQTTCWETGDALADVLRTAGYATAWISANGRGASVRGTTAGIWEGRQLDAPDINQLSKFCQRLTKDKAPVIALADFPRRERCEVAIRAGAAAVLGKPWLNVDLLATLERTIQREDQPLSAPLVKRAA
jgi:hypothetical protein